MTEKPDLEPETNVIPNYMKKYGDLIAILRNLNEENFDEALSDIEHDFFQEDYDEVASNLVHASKLYFCNEDMICKLTYKLCILLKLFNYSVLRVFASMDSFYPYEKFLKNLYNYGLWTFEEVTSALSKIDGFQILFAKEITANCPQSDSFDLIVKDYRKNNWKLYDEVVENGFLLESLGLAIKNDSVEELSKLTSDKSFNFDTKIEQEYFSKQKLSLISTAAYYKAEKCFKFLFDKKAKIDSTTVNAAMIGGDMGIIKMCEDCDDYKSCVLSSTVLTHREDVFESIPKTNEYRNPSLYDCVVSVNYKALLNYIGKNDLGADKHPALCVAAKMGLYSMCRALVEGGDKMNGTMRLGYTPLHLAVKYEHFYVVTYLCSSGADVNRLSDDLVSPFDLAEKQKYDEICSYLDYNNAKPSRQLRMKK